MIDMELLKARIPLIAQALGEVMVSEGLPTFMNEGFTLDEDDMTAAMRFRGAPGVPDFMVFMTITQDIDREDV